MKEKQTDNHAWLLLQQDSAAFESFFKDNVAALCAYAFKLVADRDTAEDIVQDFFSKLWQRREDIQVHTSPQRYAYRAVRNACFNYLRDTGSLKTEPVPEDMADEESGITAALQLQEQLSRLEKAIEGLPPQCRAIFERTCLQNRKYKEVAEEMGLSIHTVRNQVSKAYEILRNSCLLGAWMALFLLQ